MEDMYDFCDIVSQGFLLQVVMPPDVLAVREMMLIIQDAFLAKLIHLKDSLMSSIVHGTGQPGMRDGSIASHKGSVLGELMHAIADIDMCAKFRTDDHPQMALDELGWHSLLWAGELDDGSRGLCPLLTPVAQCLEDTLQGIYYEYVCSECRPLPTCTLVEAKSNTFRGIEFANTAGGIISLVFAVLLPAVWLAAITCVKWTRPRRNKEAGGAGAVLPEQVALMDDRNAADMQGQAPPEAPHAG
jgi:hypothetical protein